MLDNHFNDQNIARNMKTLNQYLLIAVCAAGVSALANQAFASESASAGCGGGCCGGMATTLSADTSTTTSTSTNAIPDLLKTCPVSGDKLGEMGDPYTFIYKGQEVKLCCKGCKKDFDKEPAKYVKLIRAADKNAKKTAAGAVQK